MQVKLRPLALRTVITSFTLSLLWQVIYRFRAPKFNAAATLIQNCWRNIWLSVCIRRRIRAKIEKAKNQAAATKQVTYRAYCARKYAKEYFEQRTKAAITIQRYVRRFLAIQCDCIASFSFSVGIVTRNWLKISVKIICSCGGVQSPFNDGTAKLFWPRKLND